MFTQGETWAGKRWEMMVSSDMAMVERSFGPVIRDLVAGGHAAQLGGLVGRAVDGQVLTELIVDGQTLGPLPVDPGATDPEQVRSAAGFVQDRLLECRTASGASVVWPTWTCPRRSGADVPVGELADEPIE